MDRTLNPVKRGNKRRRARNWKAWQLFSPDGDDLPVLRARTTPSI